MGKIRKAVIPAAGFGTRMLPITKAIPKEMITIVDKPAIQFAIEEAVASGIEEILIIVSRNKNMIIDYFDETPELDMALSEKGKLELYNLSQSIAKMAKIHFVRQGVAKGLGHAILTAACFVGNEPFAVILPDDIIIGPEKPALAQLIRLYDTYSSTIVGVQKVPEDQVSKYGIIDGISLGERAYELKTIVEKPSQEQAPSQLAALGRYILAPDIFEKLEATVAGVGGEIQLTDAIMAQATSNKVYACEFTGQRYDVGQKLGYLKAVLDYALHREDVGPDLMDYLQKRYLQRY